MLANRQPPTDQHHRVESHAYSGQVAPSSRHGSCRCFQTWSSDNRFEQSRQYRGGAFTPLEIAQANLYLMRGSYTTGQVLLVDGGMTLL
jgi:NAD(P)-dependent dehydrogenase (short-subunit alcohol dehydrogenase family)